MSTRGYGPGRSPRTAPAGGGGGTVTGADNGLSLAGTIVELGGPLINNTTIDLDGNSFQFVDFVSLMSLELTTTGLLRLNSGSNFMFLDLNDNTHQAILGQGGNVTRMVIDALNDQFQFFDNSNNAVLDFNNASSIYQYGNIAGGLRMVITSNGGAEQLHFGSSAFDYLSLAVNLGIYQMGDVDSSLNATKLIINDTTQQIALTTGIYSLVNINGVLPQINIGDGPNGSTLAVNDMAQALLFGTGGNTFMNLDAGNELFQIGALASGNGTKIILDDQTGNELITLSANRGIKTVAPTGGVSAAGRINIGSVVAAASVLDATRYLEVEINGAIVKLAIIT